MGNCWSNEPDSAGDHRNTNTAGNNQGSDQLFGGHNNARLSQSTSNSTSLGCSSHSARSSRLSGPSSSNIYTSSNTNTSLLGSENSQTLQAREEDDFPNGQILDVANLKVFTLEELKAATKDFRADTLLGQGGFGGVYKGWLKGRAAASNRDGELVIAIKRMNSTSRQGIAEWLSEVNFLGRLSHPNVVRLLGFGSENSELFLVYEFMQRGSLDNHLFGRGSNVRPLSWDTRLKVMIGAARGLNFLHSLETKVIYRDFKPSNILLDKTYSAKLSDFGLAKFGPSAGQTHVSTQVMGTHGYAAPEYIATGHLYVKSDVYGFGIVLVEILTGKRIADIMKLCGQHQSLLDWLKSNLLSRMKMRNTMDARLEGKYPSKSASKVAQLALRCVQTDPKVRPSMIEVAETLEQIEAANYEKPLKNNRKRDSHSPADHVHGRPDRV